MSLLELKDISKIYGELKALDNVSFQVNKGEWVAIMVVVTQIMVSSSTMMVTSSTRACSLFSTVASDWVTRFTSRAEASGTAWLIASA